MAGHSVIIVGGDSLIGRNLIDGFEGQGNTVWQTTRQRDRVGDRTMYLNLEEDPLVLVPTTVRTDVAVFCAAVTSMQKCEDDQDLTWRINVTNTVAVATELAAQGAFLVFLSTNTVFDGRKPFAAVDDPVNPQTEYGRQKAEAEKQLLALGRGVAIIRLGKVINPDLPLFQSWITDLKAGKTIHPFRNLIFAPISLAAAVNFVIKAAKEKRGGIFHFSGAEDISYAEAALFIARRIDVDETLVQPIESRTDAIPFAPTHATLYSDELNRNTGLVGIEALKTLSGLTDNKEIF